MTTLTKREREVLELLAEGRSNRGITTALYVTEATVETHIKQVFQKLRLDPGRESNRRVLAVLACLRGQPETR